MENGVIMNKHEITIVGGSGFVGSALARYFNKEFKVRVLDKNPLPKSIERKVEYQQCDIRNYDEVERGLENTDLVIHAAIVQIPLINEEKRLGYEVNVLGTQNVCRVVDENPSIKGMILAGSWHLFGERGLEGVIDEGFGFRPDRVEDRARLYAFSKIAQETAKHCQVIILDWTGEYTNTLQNNPQTQVITPGQTRTIPLKTAGETPLQVVEKIAYYLETTWNQPITPLQYRLLLTTITRIDNPTPTTITKIKPPNTH